MEQTIANPCRHLATHKGQVTPPLKAATAKPALVTPLKAMMVLRRPRLLAKWPSRKEASSWPTLLRLAAMIGMACMLV